MDTAYDHIQEAQDPAPQRSSGSNEQQSTTGDFNSELQEAYKAISSSPWAARLGGFLGTVKKQGTQYYENASKNLPTARENATAGLSSLTSHIRSLSVQPVATSSTDFDDKDAASSSTTDKAAPTEEHPDRPDSLPADIVKEAEGMLARFKSEAAKRLKDIEKAEDAADEALLKFGSNIRNFLRDAVTIAPPTSPNGGNATGQGATSKVLFESQDSEGRRVIHTTRFDAQLHVIHSSLDSFLKDPISPQWEAWKNEFDVEKKTTAIATDLEKHEELRRAMEKLVPERVEYKDFWTRYYFLRHVIETEEQRRRDMLKASTPADEEEVAWDEDSDEDSGDDKASTPVKPDTTSNLAASKETLKPDDNLLKPEGRRSNDEKSVADSDASYDLVSGTSTRTPGTPKKAVIEESDEEDWE
ncbi:BSD-domain-containing protein [Sporormia fimetaria CBS 119925]|uniref:BSD-domain-containing protein n=1 Tax=Sporormia fimetaria CBS 119925 TaxID=1340428 RepID=A0A6A6UZE6_9PLEO|nr:BSD-domain-containing protein [Sporormia fimetaria CBS 119925]